MVVHAQGSCDREDCRHYSDFDVYYADGTSKSLCSAHSNDNDGEWEITHVIPQHGGDDVNQVIPNYDYRMLVEATEVGLDVVDILVEGYYSALRLRKLLGTSDHVKTVTIQKRIIGDWEDI